MLALAKAGHNVAFTYFSSAPPSLGAGRSFRANLATGEGLADCLTELGAVGTPVCAQLVHSILHEPFSMCRHIYVLPFLPMVPHHRVTERRARRAHCTLPATFAFGWRAGRLRHQLRGHLPAGSVREVRDKKPLQVFIIYPGLSCCGHLSSTLKRPFGTPSAAHGKACSCPRLQLSFSHAWCARDPDMALALNVPGKLLDALAEQKRRQPPPDGEALLIHISPDQV